MKNKDIKKASVLKYDSAVDRAPRLVARGRGATADRIVSLAREHQVPLVADDNLSQMLDKLDMDIEIPAELYQAVAEVLVFVYRLNRNAS